MDATTAFRRRASRASWPRPPDPIQATGFLESDVGPPGMQLRVRSLESKGAGELVEVNPADLVRPTLLARAFPLGVQPRVRDGPSSTVEISSYITVGDEY